MINSKIKFIESFFPEKVLTNDMISMEFPTWDSSKIEEKVGVKNRYVVQENETALDLAYSAASKILERYDKNKIDFVILCTQSPEYILPTTACILQAKLGLNKNVGAFDFNLGCSGYIYGLGIAKSLINTNMAKSVLLVTSETYTKHINKLDFANRSIFGDAATATIIEVDENECLHEFVYGTDGNGACNLIIPNGGARNIREDDPVLLDAQNGNKRTENDLFMNGPEIFNFTITTIPKLINDVLQKNNLEISDIDYFIFHQANKFMLDYLRKKMKVDSEKFYNNILEIGNTVSSTIPIALKECLEDNKVKTGDKVLLCGFGVGYSWGATVITI
ncbi:3-oxoacyl-ACP synthase III family protein [Flavobacterium sp. T12S277]|uniref:3-oxoacyl-ACP synthase III family protein n=1 Tax=Flavobacterium sp. T12S277 TaxID=3402752 RepID=UPI003AE371CD